MEYTHALNALHYLKYICTLTYHESPQSFTKHFLKRLFLIKPRYFISISISPLIKSISLQAFEHEAHQRKLTIYFKAGQGDSFIYRLGGDLDSTQPAQLALLPPPAPIPLCPQTPSTPPIVCYTCQIVITSCPCSI